MSLKIKVSIFVIAASLSLIIGLNAYRFINDKFINKPQSEQDAGFFPFQPPIDEEQQQQGDKTPQPDDLHIIQAPDIPQDQLTAQGGMVKPVMSGGIMHLQERVVNEEELPAQMQRDLKEKEFSSSAMQDYVKFRKSQIMKDFDRDMQRALKGRLSPEDMANPEKLLEIINDPKVHQILLKYSKDPAFAQIISNMVKQQSIQSAVQQGSKFEKGQN